MPNLTPTPQSTDMTQSRFWTGHFFSNPVALPVSFLFDGKPVAGIPAGWNPATRRNRIDANVLQTLFEGTDDSTGLKLSVECLEYQDFPAVEWTAWLSNTSDRPTPLISDFQVFPDFADVGVIRGTT